MDVHTCTYVLSRRLTLSQIFQYILYLNFYYILDRSHSFTYISLSLSLSHIFLYLYIASKIIYPILKIGFGSIFYFSFIYRITLKRIKLYLLLRQLKKRLSCRLMLSRKDWTLPFSRKMFSKHCLLIFKFVSFIYKKKTIE